MSELSFTVPPELVEAVAAQVAARVTAELADADARPAEPWRLLKLEEAAARLGRSERWLRERATRRGELPYVRLDGGALAFLVEDLEAYAWARRVSADGSRPLADRLQAGRDSSSDAGSPTARPVGDRRVRGG